jgi:uncharacterized lipoprotein NlpE involved in copper resistance
MSKTDVWEVEIRFLGAPGEKPSYCVAAKSACAAEKKALALAKRDYVPEMKVGRPYCAGANLLCVIEEVAEEDR